MLVVQSDNLRFTPQDASDATGVPLRTVRAWIRRGELPLGEDGRAAAADVFALSERHGTPAVLRPGSLEASVARALTLAESAARDIATIRAALGLGELALPEDPAGLLDLHREADVLHRAGPLAWDTETLQRWSRVLFGLLPAHLHVLASAGVARPWGAFLTLAAGFRSNLLEAYAPPGSTRALLRECLDAALRSFQGAVFLHLEETRGHKTAKRVLAEESTHLPHVPADAHTRVRWLLSETMGG